MAGNTVANSFGFTLPPYYMEGSVNYALNNGQLFVNLGSRLQVYGYHYSGEYPGGIGTGESFCVVGRIECYGGSGVGWYNMWMIAFTGPDGVTPTYGVLTDYQFQLSSVYPWGHKLHSYGALKSYNRSIFFYDRYYAAGSRIWGNQYPNIKGGDYTQGFTLGMTGMARANTLDVIAVANADGSAYQGGPEYTTTHVTDRGINCDVEGYW